MNRKWEKDVVERMFLQKFLLPGLVSLFMIIWYKKTWLKISKSTAIKNDKFFIESGKILKYYLKFGFLVSFYWFNDNFGVRTEDGGYPSICETKQKLD